MKNLFVVLVMSSVCMGCLSPILQAQDSPQTEVSPRPKLLPSPTGSPYQGLLSHFHSRASGGSLSKIVTGILSTNPYPDSTFFTTEAPFGIPNTELESLVWDVTRNIVNSASAPEGTTLEESICNQIKSCVEPVLRENAIKSDSLLGERLLAQGISDWVRTRLAYDLTYTTWSEAQKHSFDQSQFVLRQNPPRGICGSFAVVFRDLARKMGLKCTIMCGHTRHPSGKTSGTSDHSWAMVEFSNGVVLPVDASSSSIGVADAKTLKGRIRSFWCLPIYPEEMALFMAYRHQAADYDSSFGDRQNLLKIVSVPCSAWERWDVLALDIYEPKPILSSGFYQGQR